MAKIIGTFKRKKGLPLEESQRYYYEKHAPMALSKTPDELLPRRYVHNYYVSSLDGVEEPPYDFVTEITFDDLEALQKWVAWYSTDDGKVLRDDEENFMDRSTLKFMLVEERVIGI